MAGEKTTANLHQTTFFSLKSIAWARNVHRSTEQRRREQQYRREMKKKKIDVKTVKDRAPISHLQIE